MDDPLQSLVGGLTSWQLVKRDAILNMFDVLQSVLLSTFANLQDGFMQPLMPSLLNFYAKYSLKLASQLLML